MISPPSNGSNSSTIRPIRNLDPFDCSILPYPYNNVCQEQKVIFHDVVKPDCSRLPPEYQSFCRALQSPVGPQANVWPNTAAVPPVTADQFQVARERCAALGPREFYSCLWQSTKYPW